MPNLGLPLHRRADWGADRSTHSRLETDEASGGGPFSNLFVHVAASDVPLAAGGAQIMVQDAAGVWQNVGYFAGDLTVPISFPGGVDSNIIKVGGVAISLGQKVMASSLPVVIASDQTALPITNANLDAPLSGLLTTAAFQARINTLGQKVMASSTPVVLASDQTVIPVSQSGAWSADVTDRAARLLGITYGDVGQFAQRAVSRDALVQLRTATVEYDARQIRLLTSTDVVDVSDRVGRALGVVASITAAVDISDRAARLVGKVYGDQGLFTQRAVTLDAQVQLRTAGTEYDARQIRALTTADAVNVGQWIGSAAPTVGQKTMANSLPVAIASDQTAFPVSQSGTWTVQQGTPPWTIDVTRVGGVVLTGDNSANFAAKVPTLPARANAAVPAWTEGNQVPLSVDLTGRARVYGGLDHDAVNDLQALQVAGNARAVDDPPAVVSAIGDRARFWVDRFGAQVVRRRKIRESYTAIARLAEAAARLDLAFTQVANTNKQWSTLHHAATATKEIRLQQCKVIITAFSVATQFVLELRELSAATPPLTGNPAITPRVHRIGSGAAEATCFALPGTQGSEAAVNSPLGHWAGDWAIWAAPAAQTQNSSFSVTLYDASQEDDEVLPPTAPVGVYGGWAVMLRTVGIPAVRMTIIWKFTEEIP